MVKKSEKLERCNSSQESLVYIGMAFCSSYGCCRESWVLHLLRWGSIWQLDQKNIVWIVFIYQFIKLQVILSDTVSFSIYILYSFRTGKNCHKNEKNTLLLNNS